MQYLTRGAGDRFHYRRGVPADVRALVGQREWKATIHSASVRLAEQMARKMAAEQDAIISAHRNLTPLDRADGKLVAAQSALDDAYHKGLKNRRAAQDLREAQTEMRDSLDVILPDGARRRGELISLELRLAYLQAKLDVLQMARDGHFPSSVAGLHALAYSEIVNSPTAEGLQFQKNFDAVLELFSAKELVGLITDVGGKVRALQSEIADSRDDARLLGLSRPKASSTVASDPDNPSISAALESWLDAEKQQPETAKKYRVYVRRFVEHVGDMCVRDIRKTHIRSFLEFLETLPDPNHVSPSVRGSSTMAQLVVLRRQWLEANPEIDPEEWPTLTASTVNKHLETLKALLAWVVSWQEDFTNVARDVRRRKETRHLSDYEVRPFNPDELASVLAASDRRWEPGSDEWWLIRLGILTGGRLEELCQLCRDNVRMIGAIPIIEISKGSFIENGTKVRRKLKNEMSERLIPIHPWLLENGFLSFAQAGKGSRVFASLKQSGTGRRYGHNITKAFHRLLREDLKINDARVRFHSFRHGFITALHNASVPQAQVNALAGHARAKGAAGRYINELEVPVLLEAVQKLSLRDGYLEPCSTGTTSAHCTVPNRHTLLRR